MSRPQQELPANEWAKLKAQLEARGEELRRLAKKGGHWQDLLDTNNLRILDLDALIRSTGGEEEQRPEWLVELDNAKSADRGSPVRNQVAGLLRHYIELIRRKYDRSGYDLLADAAGISTPLLYAWTSRLDRLPSREHIASLAWGIVALLDGLVPDKQSFLLDPERQFKPKKGQLSHRERLPIVLNALLRARGLSLVEGADQNTAWARIVDETESVVGRTDELAWDGFNPKPGRSSADTVTVPKLKVGWVENAPILNKDLDNKPYGFIKEVTDEVAAWLGLEADWGDGPMNWDEVPSSVLVNANKDILAPMALTAPYRLFTCQISTPLPLLFSGLNAIITAEGEQAFASKNPDAAPAKIDMLHFEYIPGNIGKWGAKLFGSALGATISGNQLTEYPDPVDHSQLELPQQVTKSLLKTPKHQGRFRCIITGQLHCYQAMRYDPDHIKPLLRLGKSKCPLQYGFIASWREPLLLKAVNFALERVVESGVYLQILEAHKDEIEKTGIADFTEVADKVADLRAKQSIPDDRLGQVAETSAKRRKARKAGS